MRAHHEIGSRCPKGKKPGRCPAELMAAARHWADGIMQCSPASIAATKAVDLSLDGSGVEASMRRMFELPHNSRVTIMPAEPVVLAAREGGVVTVTLNRPERRNGVDVATCRAMYETLREVAAGDARVVILRGAGGDFCVGADLKGGADGGPAPTLDELGPVYHAATLLHEMPQVTLAAIDGGCAGAGLGWACACDLRFASDAARFATAFLAVGVSGDMGLAWTLTRIVGPSRARDLLLFPEKLSATQALHIGLVSRVFARPELHGEVQALAASLSARNPFALRMLKANLVSAERLGLADFIEIESARHLYTTAQADFSRGVRRAQPMTEPGAGVHE